VQGEYITKITGKTGKYVNSIRIYTNKKTSPTYGLGKGDWSGGRSFTITAPSGKEIVGFYGRSGKYVDAIGAVIRTNPATQQVTPVKVPSSSNILNLKRILSR